MLLNLKCFSQTTEDQALLVIKDAKRGDTGPYSVTLKNASGTAEATVKVTVLGEYDGREVFFES